jgi:hydrogenase small subunit
MKLTRRTFMRYSGLVFAAMNVNRSVLAMLERKLASATKPPVLWLNGSSCTGCSVSFLNRIADTAPNSVVEVLTDVVDLVFHPTIMAAAGDPAAAVLQRSYSEGGYILVLEGGVPTAFNGNACVVYTLNGIEVTYMQAVSELAARASHIVSVGTCASFGGIPAAGANPTKVVSVAALTGRPVVNLSGCPANPDWVVWGLANLIAGAPVELDEHGRPVALYNRDLAGAPAPELIHDKCPRNANVNPGAPPEATEFGQAGRCLINLGCRGPATKARCEGCWNGKAGQGHWCIGVNAPCHGCVEPTYPGPQSFYEMYTP